MLSVFALLMGYEAWGQLPTLAESVCGEHGKFRTLSARDKLLCDVAHRTYNANRWYANAKDAAKDTGYVQLIRDWMQEENDNGTGDWTVYHTVTYGQRWAQILNRKQLTQSIRIRENGSQPSYRGGPGNRTFSVHNNEFFTLEHLDSNEELEEFLDNWRYRRYDRP